MTKKPKKPKKPKKAKKAKKAKKSKKTKMAKMAKMAKKAKMAKESKGAKDKRLMAPVCKKCKVTNDCSGACGIYCDHCSGLSKKTQKAKPLSGNVFKKLLGDTEPTPSTDKRTKQLYKKSMKTKADQATQDYQRRRALNAMKDVNRDTHHKVKKSIEMTG